MDSQTLIKRIAAVLLCMGFVVLPWSVWADLVVGSTRQDVIESEGEPGSEFKHEGRTRQDEQQGARRAQRQGWRHARMILHYYCPKKRPHRARLGGASDCALRRAPLGIRAIVRRRMFHRVPRSGDSIQSPDRRRACRRGVLLELVQRTRPQNL